MLFFNEHSEILQSWERIFKRFGAIFFRDTMDNLRICLFGFVWRCDYSFEGEELGLLGSLGYVPSLLLMPLPQFRISFGPLCILARTIFLLSGYMFNVVYYYDVICNTSLIPSSCPFFFRGESYISTVFPNMSYFFPTIPCDSGFRFCQVCS